MLYQGHGTGSLQLGGIPTDGQLPAQQEQPTGVNVLCVCVVREGVAQVYSSYCEHTTMIMTAGGKDSAIEGCGTVAP